MIFDGPLARRYATWPPRFLASCNGNGAVSCGSFLVLFIFLSIPWFPRPSEDNLDYFSSFFLQILGSSVLHQRMGSIRVSSRCSGSDCEAGTRKSEGEKLGAQRAKMPELQFAKL